MFQKSSTVLLKDATASGEVSGVAWSFLDAPDRQNDHILPAAFQRHQGDVEMKVEHDKSVGKWRKFALSDDAFTVEGQIDRSTPTGRDTIARAKDGDLRSLSIGFEGQYQKSGQTRIFTDLNLAEISLVRQPANAGARVHAVKHLTECTRISDFQKSLKAQLGLTNAQAKHIASLVWPSFNEDPDDLIGQLSNFKLR